MSQKFTLLSPINLNILQRNQAFSKASNEELNPYQIFEPTILQFKKLAIGQYFWFVADPIRWKTPSAGGSIDKMTPLKLEDLIGQPVEPFLKNVHPDDIIHMFAFSDYWVSFQAQLPLEKWGSVRPTIYVRLQNPQFQYYWAMVQFVDTILDGNGKIIYGLTLVTDISHLKKDGIPLMSILNTEDENCHHFICVDGQGVNKIDEKIPRLTNREIEVLRHLAAGLASKQIAAELNNSIKTIDNHRQNMLHKTNTKSSAELVGACIRWGYV